MTVYTILIYLVLAIVGNGAFYFACQGEYDSCSIVSVLFFNIAVLCQLLPLSTNRETYEKNQNKGQKLICSLYLLSVIIVCIWSLDFEVSYVKSGTFQLILLGIFLVVFFSMARANVMTHHVVYETKNNQSLSLMEAKANIRRAIATCTSIEQRDILREVSSELDSMVVSCDTRLAGIDEDILVKVTTLCNAPDKTKKIELSKLIQKRKTMAMISLR